MTRPTLIAGTCTAANNGGCIGRGRVSRLSPTTACIAWRGNDLPDKRKHRGSHPADEGLFAHNHHVALRRAVAEYSWLLTRSYARESALKLVGDRHNLTVRQRLAVMRCACSDQSLCHRQANMMTPAYCRKTPIAIDGYNLLITIESALSGGLVLIARDACRRDLASVHGTYRNVEETVPALQTIMDHLDSLDLTHIDWYLDRPVSNSGRLKTLMAEVLEARPTRSLPPTPWNIELVDSPDAVLVAYRGTVATCDSVVLDKCASWINLAAEVIQARIPNAWIVDLREPAPKPVLRPPEGRDRRPQTP